MGVMLPGAMELPHDDIIFKLEKLEETNIALTRENTALTNENTALTDENEKLKIRIAELEASK